MATYKDILPKLRYQIVYLENTFEEIAIKCMPGPGAKTFAKPKGRIEYELKSSTALVTETLLEAKEITKEQYENY